MQNDNYGLRDTNIRLRARNYHDEKNSFRNGIQRDIVNRVKTLCYDTSGRFLFTAMFLEIPKQGDFFKCEGWNCTVIYVDRELKQARNGTMVEGPVRLTLVGTDGEQEGYSSRGGEEDRDVDQVSGTAA